MMIERYLKALHIPHTQYYLREEYKACPNRNTLWGIGYLLSKYGIEYVTIRLKDKEKIRNIEGPFLAQLSGEMVLVVKLSEEKLLYYKGKKATHCSYAEFLNKFSGVVLFATNIDNAAEPDYSRNKRLQIISYFSKAALPLAACALLAYWTIKEPVQADAFFLSILFPGILGLVISALLLQKTVSGNSPLADRVCSLFGQTQCGNLLLSDAANVVGNISWSECGVAFFSGNIFLLCAFGDCARSVLPLISIITLPFTLWSIWYQAIRAKQWCTLCLLVQAVLWIQFLLLLTTGAFQDISVNTQLFYHFALCCLANLFILLSLHKWKDLYLKGREQAHVVSQLKEIKYDPDIFQLLLQKQAHFTISTETSQLDFNHTEICPFQIAVLSNPFCEPCAEMHMQLNTLYEKGYPIKYIFTSFTPNLEEANRYLIAYYFKFGAENCWQLLSDWYSGGQKKGPLFFEGKISYAEAHTDAVEDEVTRQREWVSSHGLTSTPVVFVNGHALSGNLRINDIVELSNVNSL